MRTYLDTLTINGFSNKRPKAKKEARKTIETITGYPYPLINLSVTQGKFTIEAKP